MHRTLYKGKVEQGEIVGQLEKGIAILLVPRVELPHEVAADQFFKCFFKGSSVGDSSLCNLFVASDPRHACGKRSNYLQVRTGVMEKR